MRVVPLHRPLKEHQPLYADFLISLLNIWQDFKVLSGFIQKWIQPPARSDYRLYRILSSYWLVHFYLMKKSAKVLHYTGLACGMLEFLHIFFSQVVIQRAIVDFPAFWRPVWGKRLRFVTMQSLTPTSRMIRCIFLWSGSELWSLFKNSRSKLKNQKPHGGLCPFPGLSNGTTIKQI